MSKLELLAAQPTIWQYATLEVKLPVVRVSSRSNHTEIVLQIITVGLV